MRSLRLLSIPVLLLLSVVGCGFSPGPAEGEVAAGATSGTGNSGAGGSTTIGTGQGLSGGGAGTSGSGTGGTTSCGQATVPIMPLPPDILIVEDRSGSMNDDQNDKGCNGGCGANSKWAQVTAAINQVVSQTDTTVNWGLKFFADMDNVCGVNATVGVPVAPMNAAPIAAAITASTSANGGVMNGSHTPTAQAEDAGVAYLQTLTDTNSKYILLATDGLPNCTAADQNADNSAATEQSVAAALTAKFPTFVVGIATAADAMATATLNAMAMNGGEAQAGAATQYYSVADTASLVAALNKIVGIVASCTISLSTAPAGFTNVVISATDTTSGNPIAIPQDPTNGWAYDATKTNILLNGTACADLQNGTYSNFNFNYACAGVTICIDRDAAGHCITMAN
jgi:hypothetical protein